MSGIQNISCENKLTVSEMCLTVASVRHKDFKQPHTLFIYCT